MFKGFVNHSWEGTVSQAMDLKKKAFWLVKNLKVILVFGPGSSWGAGGLDLVVCSPSSSEDWPLELPCHPTWKSCWTQLIQNST